MVTRSPRLPATRWRRLALPGGSTPGQLTSLQQRLIRTGGRLTKHAGYCRLLLADRHLTRRLPGAIVQRLVALSVPAGYQPLRVQPEGPQGDPGEQRLRNQPRARPPWC
jgi:hypothetical protein